MSTSLPTDADGASRALSACPTWLVTDVPAAEDHFGTHDPVADAIHRLITTEGGGRSIGLAGVYGAGKSTVIQLLSGRLRTNDKSTLWVFDAWAHEGDPLRRTFLESLIGHLQALPGWIDPKTWEKKAKELAQRRKVVETKNYPRLSWFGAVLAASSLAVPVGLAILNDTLRETSLTLIPGVGPVVWRAVLAVALCIAPLLVFLGILCGWRLWGKGRDHREALALFVQKGVSESTTETSETPDPTSIEFERHFAQLMGEALSDPERKAVLVIDNLDRVAPSEALAIWSTLQTFLQPGGARPEWLDRLWVILPYDSKAIAKLWQQEEQMGGGLATAFLEKSFHIRFEVPPPLLSDWRAYLMKLLREALPQHTDAEFHKIYRLIAVRRGGTRESPTPREIKVFVNQLGAIHRQHGHSVPLLHMALYVLERRERPGVSIRDVIFDTRSLPAAEMALVGPDAKDSLAALEFGVGIPQARQLLLEDPIANALSTGDADELRVLANASHGFWDVLEHALERLLGELDASESASILHAAVAIEANGLFDSVEEHRRATVIDQIRDAAMRIEAWLPAGEQVEAGIEVVGWWTQDSDFLLAATKAFGAIAATKALTASETGTSGGIETLVERSLGVAEIYHAITGEYPPVGSIVVPGEPDAYISVFQDLIDRKIDSADARYFLFVPERPGDVVADLLQAIGGGQFDMTHYGALRTLHRCESDTDWTPVVNALQNRLQAGSGITADEVNALLATLLRLRTEEDAEPALKQLVDHGHIGHLVWICASSSTVDWDAIARCLYLHMEMRPAMTPLSHVGSSAAGYEKINEFCTEPPKRLADKLARLVMNYDRAELLSEQLDEEVCTPLLAEAMATFIAQGRAEEVYSPDVLLDHWTEIRSHTPLADLLEAIQDKNPLVERMLESKFNARLADLYLNVLKHLNALERQALAAWCLAGVQEVDAARWKAELEVQIGLLALARYLAEQGCAVDLSDDFREALLTYAREIAAKESHVVGDEADWQGYFALLDAESRLLWRDALYEAAKRQEGELSPDFLSTFGEEMAASETARSDPAFVSHLVVPLLRNRNADGLVWWRRFMRSHPAWVSGLSDRYRRVLRSELFENEDGDDAASDQISSVIRDLRFQRPKAKR